MKTETRVGLYLTIIVHLLALIGILAYQIQSVRQKDASFELDFTQQEREEQQQAEEERLARRAELSAELEDMIRGVQRESRNVAVDATQRRALRDDRHSNPNEVYDEAKALQDKLDAARKAVQEQQGDEDVAAPVQKQEEKKNVPAYTGPSVLEYTLEGRKIMNPSTPAYKCLGGGDVTVAIQVDPKGIVLQATIIADFSSQDRCLQEYAIEAAKKTRFTSSPDAPPRQEGEIVYRFIPQ